MLSTTTRRCLATRPLPPLRQPTVTRTFQSSVRLRKDEAFSPDKTRPEEQDADQKGAVGEEIIGVNIDPTDSSANKAEPGGKSKEGSATEEDNSAKDRQGQSRGGSPSKAGSGRYGGGGGGGGGNA